MPLDCLDPEQEYPFRASLTKIPRCGMCKFAVENLAIAEFIVSSCQLGHELSYPLMVPQCHCADYKYMERNPPDPPEKGKIWRFGIRHTGWYKAFPECAGCGFLFQHRCTGIESAPIRLNSAGKCEFFVEKGNICKYAIPTLQYGDFYRNNFCRRPPEERDAEMRSSWKCYCPSAHRKDAKRLKCYR